MGWAATEKAKTNVIIVYHTVFILQLDCVNCTDINTIDKTEDKKKGKTVHVVLSKVLIIPNPNPHEK